MDDPALRAELRVAVDQVLAKRSFGLVFESHLPERVRLHDHPIRRGVQAVQRDGDGLPARSSACGVVRQQVLDLQSASVRAAIRAFDGGQILALYESESARPYR